MTKNLLAILLILIPSLAFCSEPFTLFSGAGERTPKQPQACIDPKGRVHVAFGVGDEVYYCKVESEQKLEPKLAFKVSKISLGMRRGPRIAWAGNTIVITAIGGKEGHGKDGDVVAYRSTDDRNSWIGPVRVNDVESSAREGLHAMTASQNGILWCVWLDLRERGTQLFTSKSMDQGKTWSKNVRVYRSPDGSVCECCHPSILTSGKSIHILFRNSLNGNRDMYVVSSLDQGETFGPVERLGIQQWRLNACPMDGGMMAITPRGEIITAWRRDSTVFTSLRSSESETMLGNGEQPWIASNTNGTYVAWITKRDGELRLVKVGTDNPIKIADKARDPMIVASDGGNSIAYLFWEQQSGERVSIVGQRIP